MPPLGAIIVTVGTLGLIGLGVAAAIGAAVVVVPLLLLAVIGWRIYRHVQAKRRYSRPLQTAHVRREARLGADRPTSR